MTSPDHPSPPLKSPEPRKTLTPAAARALAEAAARRTAQASSTAAAGPKEVGGPSGPDPVRYGDWERKGIASDF